MSIPVGVCAYAHRPTLCSVNPIRVGYRFKDRVESIILGVRRACLVSRLRNLVVMRCLSGSVQSRRRSYPPGGSRSDPQLV